MPVDMSFKYLGGWLLGFWCKSRGFISLAFKMIGWINKTYQEIYL